MMGLSVVTLLLFVGISMDTVLAYGSVSMSVPVYTQTYTIDKYMYAANLPEMSTFTICMWVFGQADDDDRADDYILSYSTSLNTNEFLVNWSNENQIRVYIQAAYYVTTTKEENDARMIGWHKHCWTWRANGQFRWYVNKDGDPTVMELWKSVDVGGNTLRANGNIVIMQEQDAVLGNFDLNQMIQGRYALFNMWDYDMTKGQLEAVGCQSEGNVLTMSGLSNHGGAVLTEEVLQCGSAVEERELADQRLKKTNSGLTQTLTMCKVSGAKLSNHVLETETVASVNVCLQRCTRHSECLSMNYLQSSGSCELNDVAGSDWNIPSDDYEDGLSGDHLHYTTDSSCYI